MPRKCSVYEEGILVFDGLKEINRNKNGDYWFIYSVKGVRNKINTKAKARDEVLIVGVPQDKLVAYLNAQAKMKEGELSLEEEKN